MTAFNLEISHNAPAQRFEVLIDGLLCECTYQINGPLMALLHTEVPPALGGRGIAAALVRAAFDWAQLQGLRVQPVCSYVQTYVQRHPEARALLA